MYYQQNSFYRTDMNQFQIPPCMRNAGMPAGTTPPQMMGQGQMNPTQMMGQGQMNPTQMAVPGQTMNPAQMMGPDQMVNPMQMNPEAEMPEYQMEMMYPRTYYIIYPEIIRHCDMYDMTSGHMSIPTPEEIDRMTEEISSNVEGNVEAAMQPSMREDEMRQFGFAGRGLVRDLVGILLLRELFQRRHRPFRRNFPHHMGY